MRRESQIRHKLKQVIFRHRKKFVEHGLSRRPENCEHNRVVSLPIHTGNRATIRICDYADDDTENDVVCDSTMGGEVQARACPYFGCCNSPETLKDEFSHKLGLGEGETQAGVLAKEYPDIIALMWVLGTGKQNGATPPESESNILAFFGSDDIETGSISDEPLLDEEPVDE